MDTKLSLYERILFTKNSSEKNNYLIGHWIHDGRVYIASHEDNTKGFYLDEVLEVLTHNQDE